MYRVAFRDQHSLDSSRHKRRYLRVAIWERRQISAYRQVLNNRAFRTVVTVTSGTSVASLPESLLPQPLAVARSAAATRTATRIRFGKFARFPPHTVQIVWTMRLSLLVKRSSYDFFQCREGALYGKNAVEVCFASLV